MQPIIECGARDVAQSIARGPRLAPPGSENDPRTSDRFFDLDEELTKKLTVLLEVTESEERDPLALANAFSALAETCVQCHAIYMPERKR
jgi:hypothetical protein